MSYITLNSILSALEREIKAVWPGAVVYQNVMPKNFERPSFYVEMVEFSMRQEAGSPASVSRLGKFRIVAFARVDEYHNSQVSELDTRLDRLAGIFATGFLVVEDRALHSGVETGQILSTDAAELVVSFSWLEDLADYAEIPATPLIERVAIHQN